MAINFNGKHRNKKKSFFFHPLLNEVRRDIGL